MRKPNVLPRLDMRSPPHSSLLRLSHHQKASSVRRNAIWNDIASPNLGVRSGRLLAQLRLPPYLARPWWHLNLALYLALARQSLRLNGSEGVV